MDTQLVQPLERRTRGIIRKHTLGQLQLEQCRGKTILVESASYELRKLRVFQLLGRDIQCQSRRRGVLVTPARKLRAGGVQHPTTDVDDQTALFSGRHKLARLTHAIACGLPSEQRFNTRQDTVGDGKLRLIEE